MPGSSPPSASSRRQPVPDCSHPPAVPAAAPLPLPTPALPRQLPAAVPDVPTVPAVRTPTEMQIPIYRPTPGELPTQEHQPEDAPAFRPSRPELSAAELASARQWQAERTEEEVAAAWAALPIVIWGGLTLAGCVYHGAFFLAALVLTATLGGANLPFVARRRFLPLGVAG
ncbi:MAG: hypothetical protein ACREJ2_04665, partial [Planctomycetota bacterium]